MPILALLLSASPRGLLRRGGPGARSGLLYEVAKDPGAAALYAERTAE